MTYYHRPLIAELQGYRLWKNADFLGYKFYLCKDINSSITTRSRRELIFIRYKKFSIRIMNFYPRQLFAELQGSRLLKNADFIRVKVLSLQRHKLKFHNKKQNGTDLYKI